MNISQTASLTAQVLQDVSDALSVLKVGLPFFAAFEAAANAGYDADTVGYNLFVTAYVGELPKSILVSEGGRILGLD